MMCAARAAVETRDDGKYRKMARLVIETLIKTKNHLEMENIGVIRHAKSDPAKGKKFRKLDIDPSALEDLPTEIKLHIVSHLEDPEDIKNLSATSREFRQFYNDYMWDIKRMLFDNAVRKTFPMTEYNDNLKDLINEIGITPEKKDEILKKYRVKKLAPFFRVMRFLNVAYLPRREILKENPAEILPAIPGNRYYGNFIKARERNRFFIFP